MNDRQKVGKVRGFQPFRMAIPVWIKEKLFWSLDWRLEHNVMGLIVHARIEWEHRLVVDGAWFSSAH